MTSHQVWLLAAILAAGWLLRPSRKGGSPMTAPFLLLVALGVGTWLMFHSTFILGLVLVGAGLLGLVMFMATVGSHQRPGENETVIEERHYIGRDDDHRRYRY